MSYDPSSTTDSLPKEYETLPSSSAFQAPAHNLSKSQAEQVVELAERTGHEQGGQSVTSSHSGSGLTGGLTEGSSHGGLTSEGSSSHSGLTGQHTTGSHNTGRDLTSEVGGHSSTGGHGVGAGTGAGLAGAGAASSLGRDRDHDDDRTSSKPQQDTSNRAPTLGQDSRVHQNDLNSTPGVGDAAAKPGQANVGGTNTGKTGPEVGKTGSDPAAEGSLGEAGSEYPEQRHAGKTGLGPHYQESHGGILQTIKDKLHGGQKKESEHAVEEDRVNQDPLKNPVGGDSSISGNKGHLNPEDSKGLASKRLGEDSTTLGEK